MSQKVVIIKYNAGNVVSVTNALERLGVNPVLSDDPRVIEEADKLIFPGVGEASSAMAYIQSKGLDTVIKSAQQPFLGICLGLQLMCSRTEEGNVDCLGIFDIPVLKFPKQFDGITYKVPQIGWNSIHKLQSPLMEGVHDGEFVYFVHSFYAPLCEHSIAISPYSTSFSAALHKNNFYAVQFHPEKSAETGLKILKNFIEL
ncbi:MAG: imidazole glycerol phosphate synthase subunit HisH [Cytophagales bacterium]